MTQPLSQFDKYQQRLPDIAIQLYPQQHRSREVVEGFIHDTFKQAYGAEISHFLPQLMAVQRGEKTEAALGLCHADDHSPLFLECYLDTPLEQLLAEQFQRPISRQRIVEVGNLAAAPPGAARYLFMALNAYLLGAGAEWAVFTAVPRVINSFAKLGIQLQPIAEATIERLPEPQGVWGSYYDSQPQVVVGNVAYGAERITALIQHTGSGALQNLWDTAVFAGEQRCLQATAQPLTIL